MNTNTIFIYQLVWNTTKNKKKEVNDINIAIKLLFLLKLLSLIIFLYILFFNRILYNTNVNVVNNINENSFGMSGASLGNKILQNIKKSI